MEACYVYVELSSRRRTQSMWRRHMAQTAERKPIAKTKMLGKPPFLSKTNLAHLHGTVGHSCPALMPIETNGSNVERLD